MNKKKKNTIKKNEIERKKMIKQSDLESYGEIGAKWKPEER